jgi:hypothetical protein
VPAAARRLLIRARHPQGLSRSDCNLGFDAQVKLLTGQPDLVPARDEAVEPYRYFNSADGHVSYVITQPDAPAHPAILIQRVGGERSTTTGCAYGDKAEFAKLKSYIENLKAGALTP